MIDAKAARELTNEAVEAVKELDITCSYWHSTILDAATLGRNHCHITIKITLSKIALAKLRELGFNWKEEADPTMNVPEGFKSYRIMW